MIVKKKDTVKFRKPLDIKLILTFKKMSLKRVLPPNLFELIDRAGIATSQQITMLSLWDIKKITNLCIDDIILVKNIVSEYVCPTTITGNILKKNLCTQNRISTGCSGIDSILQGGLRKGTITEVFGESGCGKTQLALQLALHNCPDKSVYICTEDPFPSKRFEDMKRNLPHYDLKYDYGNNIFVEHIIEAHDLLSCVRVRMSKLLAENKISLIIIDSVAAPFRCENTNYVRRADDLRDLAISLLKVAQDFNLAILCINQVTSSFDESDTVLPSLGLAWSNMISTRLMLKKTSQTFGQKYLENTNHNIRELHIIFSPDVPNSNVQFIITSNGVQSIPD